MSEEMGNIYNITEEGLLGQVQIADEVLAVIAGIAAGEVEGVSKLTGNITNEIASKFGMKNPAKGVRVELLPGEVKIDLTVEILYEYSIPTVSQKIQEKVKQAIETMTGLVVTSVNIRVGGVKMADAN